MNFYQTYPDFLEHNCYQFCLSHGFECVPTHDKIPRKGWKWKERRLKTDEDMIAFLDCYSLECGIPTGINGLVILDCDLNKETGEPQGRDNLIKLLGRDPASETLTIRSPSGGLHYYFKVTDGSRYQTNTGKVAPSVDVRGYGGLIIAPWSITTKGQYVPVNDCEIAALPADLAKLLPRCHKELKTIPPARAPRVLGFNMRAEREAQRLLDDIYRASVGERNDILNKKGWQLLRLANYIPLSELKRMLTDAGHRIGLKAMEVAATIKSAERDALRHLRVFR